MTTTLTSSYQTLEVYLQINWLKRAQIFHSFVVQYLIIHLVGLGGLGVTCSPRDPRFAGRLWSMGFFRT